MILGVVYLFAKTFIGNYLVVRHGKCVKALLINEFIRTKGHRANLLYEFWHDGEYYYGNSLEIDSARVGETVCIVFSEAFPGINRPLKYFEVGKVNCDCTQK